MEITGMLAIGNNEKCPFCDVIITEDIDTFKHLTDKHPISLEEALFSNDLSEIKEKE